MKNIKRIIAASLVGVALLGSTVACTSDADVASKNLSKQADNFQILRRVVFYNGITGDYILVIEGYCSVDNTSGKLAVTCKTGKNEFKKDFLGTSDNVTWFEEQIEDASVSTNHYEVIFKPLTVIPQPEIH